MREEDSMKILSRIDAMVHLFSESSLPALPTPTAGFRKGAVIKHGTNLVRLPVSQYKPYRGTLSFCPLKEYTVQITVHLHRVQMPLGLLMWRGAEDLSAAAPATVPFKHTLDHLDLVANAVRGTGDSAEEMVGIGGLAPARDVRSAPTGKVYRPVLYFLWSAGPDLEP